MIQSAFFGRVEADSVAMRSPAPTADSHLCRYGSPVEPNDMTASTLPARTTTTVPSGHTPDLDLIAGTAARAMLAPTTTTLPITNSPLDGTSPTLNPAGAARLADSHLKTTVIASTRPTPPAGSLPAWSAVAAATRRRLRPRDSARSITLGSHSTAVTAPVSTRTNRAALPSGWRARARRDTPTTTHTRVPKTTGTYMMWHWAAKPPASAARGSNVEAPRAHANPQTTKATRGRRPMLGFHTDRWHCHPVKAMTHAIRPAVLKIPSRPEPMRIAIRMSTVHAAERTRALKHKAPWVPPSATYRGAKK